MKHKPCISYLQAAAWVDSEIDKLIAVIERVGTKSGEGGVAVTFGELFAAYQVLRGVTAVALASSMLTTRFPLAPVSHLQDISDTLVGILMRAKKRGRLVYEGDMLFRGTHDDTLITVLG